MNISQYHMNLFKKSMNKKLKMKQLPQTKIVFSPNIGVKGEARGLMMLT